jgi:hypothetical protein
MENPPFIDVFPRKTVPFPFLCLPQFVQQRSCRWEVWQEGHFWGCGRRLVGCRWMSHQNCHGQTQDQLVCLHLIVIPPVVLFVSIPLYIYCIYTYIYIYIYNLSAYSYHISMFLFFFKPYYIVVLFGDWDCRHPIGFPATKPKDHIKLFSLMCIHKRIPTIPP